MDLEVAPGFDLERVEEGKLLDAAGSCSGSGIMAPSISTGRMGTLLRIAVSISTRTGSAAFIMRAGAFSRRPSQSRPITATRRSLEVSASAICLRKSPPKGMLSMSMKRLFWPERSTRRSKMRPDMPESARR
jgi:hypothetical protein